MGDMGEWIGRAAIAISPVWIATAICWAWPGINVPVLWLVTAIVATGLFFVIVVVITWHVERECARKRCGGDAR